MKCKIKKLIQIIVESELSTLYKNDIIVYFDMDGVLANFDKDVKQRTKNSNEKHEFDLLIDRIPELKNLSYDELYHKFKGRQDDPEMAKLKKSFNRYRKTIYAAASKPKFFINLEPMPGAKDMLIASKEITGKLPNILTAPLDTSPTCKEEKREWVEKHFLGLYDKFFCTQNKEKFASDERVILIDDRTKYTDRFSANGGQIILHKNPKDTIEELKDIVSKYDINEISAVGIGGGAMQPSGKITGTGGNPLGGDMADQHRMMWSGEENDNKTKEK